MIPYNIQEILELLEQKYGETSWLTRWKLNEKEKDDQQRNLDFDFYDKCERRKWDEAMQLLYQGATNDYVDSYTDTLSAFVWIHAFNQKALMDQLILKFPYEIKKVYGILSVSQSKNMIKIVKLLNPIFGDEEWISRWKEQANEKGSNQHLKNAALYCACWVQNWEMATLCIQTGSTNDFLDTNGNTALMLAALVGNLSVVEMIITKFKHEIRRKNRKKQSVLHYAFKKGNNFLGERLLEYDVDRVLLQLLLTDPRRRRVSIKCGLQMINQTRNISVEVENDFKFIKNQGLANNRYIRKNMKKLIYICEYDYKLDMTKLIKNIFVQKYFLDEPLAWRYQSKISKTMEFVASYFYRRDIKENIDLTSAAGKIEV